MILYNSLGRKYLCRVVLKITTEIKLRKWKCNYKIAEYLMEERVQLSILLDMYGELLTEKQIDIMELYYNDDLSLAEISEITNTSRQAVYDIIKRCHKLLLQYEEKLELMNQKLKMEEVKATLIKWIDLLNVSDDKSLIMLNKLKEYISDNI